MSRIRFALQTTVVSAALTLVVCSAVVHAPRAQAQSISALQAQYQAQLAQINAEIDSLNANLSTTKQQQTSLERDLQILDDQIKKTKLEIQRRNLAITQTSLSIQQKENNISGLNDKLQSEYESLAAILRETNQRDTTSVVVAALSSASLSDFFADIDQFAAINREMQQSFTDIQTNKTLNEQQKADLEDQLQEQTQLRQVQQLQQQQLQSQESQKNQILAATKGQEKAYQNLIKTKQQSAAQIRAALFELTGSKSISFEQALQYATLAESKTGVRAAFLLGIIKEESNLGENVGTGNWKTDMHPTRDAPIFQAITASLGLDPNSMPVSRKPWYGWGGAMGPAQFIPSTWACYAGYINQTTGKCSKNPDGTWNGPWQYEPSKDRIGAMTGNKPPSPWNPPDAFMAAAIYLKDSGAAKQTSTAEFKAAMCYLAGCGNTNPDLQFYGNDVMGFAADFQQQINIINGS